jgi:hypothetical protein
MSVIRRGLLALILVAPLAMAASVASAPSSRANASCSGPSATGGVGYVETAICLTIDAAPAKAQPLTDTSTGQPLVCWLEPQYTPAQLKTLIEADMNLPVRSYGEGGPLYLAWQTNYRDNVKPSYHLGDNGWWWGVSCDISNPLASTYAAQLWSEIPGMDMYHPWEWEPTETIAPGPKNQVTTPAMLALYAKEAATLDKPTGEMSPAYSGGASTQTVGLPTYFWGTIGPANAPVVQHTITASVQWLSSTVTAVPTKVTITTTGTVASGKSTIDCPVTNGHFGTPDTSNANITSDCSFTYTQPSNDITITMVTNWKISWTEANGATGWPATETSQTVTFGGIKVQEVQTINNG